MKQKLLFLLTALMLLTTGNAWADRVYFNDFNTGSGTTAPDGLTIHGDGSFVDEGDSKFGMVFQNGGGAQRTHYLQMPSDVLSHSVTTKEMTIGFWVNMKDATNFWFSPLFSAYGAAPSGDPKVNTWPVFICQSRGLLQLNCAGIDNFTAEDNVAGTNAENTFWLDGAQWHYYAVSITESSAKIYIDGNIFNEWNISGEVDHSVSGLFSNGADLSYVCLGGNQAWDWADNDPAFAFDDFAVYDEALSAEQINQIIYKKSHPTETYAFNTATPPSSWGCTSSGDISVDGSSLQILENPYFEMNGRFAGGTKSGNVASWFITTSGLREGSANASKDFAILNLAAGDNVTINYSANGAAFTFQGANNITGLDAGTAVVSGNKYEIESAGNLLIRCTRSGSNYPTITSIVIETSVPVLSRPTITFNSMTETGGLYYPKVTLWSSDEGVTFKNGLGETITSPYTFTSPGTLTVYTVKDGCTNSAKATYTVSNGWILANSVNISSLAGTVNYATGNTLANGDDIAAGTWAVPGIACNNDNWKYRTQYIESTKGTRTVTCSVLNENRIATYKHSEPNSSTTYYDYLTSSNNSKSFARYERLYQYDLYVMPSEVVNVTIGSTGYATFSSPVPLNFAGIDGLTAYVATGVSDGKINFTSVTTAPANTGLLLKGTAGAYEIPVTASAETPESNLMVGCIVETAVAADATSKFNNYVLVNNSGTVEFQSLSEYGATIPAGKAFLKNGAFGAGARLAIAFDEEDPTAINAIDATVPEANAQKDGKYLIDNKIVLVKNGVKYGANGQKLN